MKKLSKLTWGDVAALLEVCDLRAGYGDVDVVHCVSVCVEDGEVVTVLGANGAGKSTVLNAIMGLIHPRHGSIRFRGTSLVGLESHAIVECGVVLVPEGRHIFPTMTVLENLELGGYLPRCRAGRQEALRGVYRLFPRLEERRQQAAGTLSGGEQQMLAIGRGLMATPRLLILDEPSLGLAPNLIEEIFAAIREINAAGTTILLVEQNAMQSLELATRGYVLENGRTVLEGPVTDLINDDYIKTAYLGL